MKKQQQRRMKFSVKAAVEVVPGEEFAGAVGGFEHAVAEDAGLGNVVALHEPAGERGEVLELGLGGAAEVEVSDEADADAELVEFGMVVDAGVGAGDLLEPARADFDLAVAGEGTVADDKIVAKLVPAAMLAVFAVEHGGAAGGRGGVVDDDVAPFSFWDGGNPGAGAGGRGDGRAAAGPGDDLTRAEGGRRDIVDEGDVGAAAGEDEGEKQERRGEKSFRREQGVT